MKEQYIHIDTGGDKYFHLDKGMQNFHREDGPAIEYADGDKEWWVNGKRHREDGPAIEQEDVKSWYIKGNLHREDGPAVEFHDGSKAWWVDGELHREDGPAIEYSDGTKAWYINGKRHREDGPAAEYEGGYKEWWVNGKELTEEEFNDRNKVEVIRNSDIIKEMKKQYIYIDEYGNKFYYSDESMAVRFRHREDGPAIEWADGSKVWYVDGGRHREDGPAVEDAGGFKAWYIDGVELTEEEFNDRDRIEVTFDEIAEKLGAKEQRKVAARLDDEAHDASQFIHKLGEVQEQEFDKLWERVKSKGWMKGFDDSEDAREFLWEYCFNRSIYTDGGGSIQSFSEMCDAEWMSTDRKGFIFDLPDQKGTQV